MTTNRDIETAALEAIESANLSEPQRYVAWLLVIVRQLLIECPQTKRLEEWELREIIEFAKKHEDVKPLPH